jgi:hypothetical protein
MQLWRELPERLLDFGRRFPVLSKALAIGVFYLDEAKSSRIDTEA